MELWVGCIAGALEETDYIARLAKAGFDAINVEPTRVYDLDDARAFLSGHGIDVDAIAPLARDAFMSAFVRARKPAGDNAATAGPERGDHTASLALLERHSQRGRW